MTREWNSQQPIYRQIRDGIVDMILDGVLKDGDPLPSVRTVAAEQRVNPLTVLKAYQQLADDAVVTKRRGIGMYVQDGARALLLREERARFVSEEWPRVLASLRRLDLRVEDLLAASTSAALPPHKE